MPSLTLSNSYFSASNSYCGDCWIVCDICKGVHAGIQGAAHAVFTGVLNGILSSNGLDGLLGGPLEIPLDLTSPFNSALNGLRVSHAAFDGMCGFIGGCDGKSLSALISSAQTWTVVTIIFFAILGLSSPCLCIGCFCVLSGRGKKRMAGSANVSTTSRAERRRELARTELERIELAQRANSAEMTTMGRPPPAVSQQVCTSCLPTSFFHTAHSLLLAPPKQMMGEEWLPVARPVATPVEPTTLDGMSAPRFCPECGTPIQPGARFCPTTGVPISQHFDVPTAIGEPTDNKSRAQRRSGETESFVDSSFASVGSNESSVS